MPAHPDTMRQSMAGAAAHAGAVAPGRLAEAAEDLFYPSSDGEPMAQNTWQGDAIVSTAGDLKVARPGAFVAADLFVYPERGNRNRKVAPDVLVAFGVGDHPRMSYRVWREGKPPDWVLEVASQSTVARDLDYKERFFAEMGVREFWLFDPSARGRGARGACPSHEKGGQFPSGARLQGLKLAGGEYRRLGSRLVDGERMIHSEALGLHVRREGRLLRFRDPKTGEDVPHQGESEKQRKAETRRRKVAEARAEREAQERKAAEARIAELEAALKRAASGHGTQNCGLRVRSVDSEAGSASATFTVETVPTAAGDGNCAILNPAPPLGRRALFTFELPSLTGLDSTLLSDGVSAKPVQLKFKADAPAGSGWPSTAEEITTATHPVTRVTAPLNIVQYRPALSLQALGFALQNGSLVSAASSEIDLAAGRTGFTAPGRALLSIVSVGRLNANLCTLRDSPYSNPWSACTLQHDGTPFSLSRRGDGRGDLNVTVTGDFRDGDVVFLDLDGDRMPGAGEDLDLQADGSMQESFRLDYVAGNPNAAAGERGELDREEGVATKNLYYLPNGTDALRPGEYRTTFTITTDDATVADIVDRPQRVLGVLTGIRVPIGTTHTTSYTVTEDMQVAYAIPPQRAGDSGTVRVNCKGSTPCTLYLECDDPDGMSYFKQVEEPVPGRSTLVLTAEGLSDALDLGEGVWESGRMSCTVHSTRDISVQQLTRSAAGVLVNNTYVDN